MICHKSIIGAPKTKKNIFFTNLAPRMSHDKQWKKLFILLAPQNIYEMQKTESVYLILKNNYGPFSETDIFQKFP